jgi:hypothetical protein
MNKTSLNRLLATTALAAALATLSYAPVAALPVLFGGATADGAAGEVTDIQPGQTVTATEMLQLVAPDGSIITVEPGSVFTLTGEGDNISFELVSGAMRVASSGTPVSIARGGVTITTAGGAFSAFEGEGAGLEGRVNGGTATVATGSGSRDFATGEGYVATETSIAGTFTPPAPSSTQLAQNGSDTNYSPADEQGSEGSEIVEEAAGGGSGGYGGTPPVTGIVVPVTGTEDTGYVVAYAADAIGIDARDDVTVTIGSGGELNRYMVGDGSGEDLERNSNASLERGNSNGNIFIERWAGGETNGNYYNSFNGPTYSSMGRTSHQGFHIVYGQSTAEANIPATGIATYALVAATNPTMDNGRFAPGTFSGELGIAFGATFKVGVDFAVDMPGDHVYLIQTAGGADNPSAIAQYTDLSKGLFRVNSIGVAQGGAACPSSSCAASIYGLFGGTAAEDLGIAYRIVDSSAPTDEFFRGTQISGAAVFNQDSYDAGAGGPPPGSEDAEESGTLDRPMTASTNMTTTVYVVPAVNFNNTLYPNSNLNLFDEGGVFSGFTRIQSGNTDYARGDAVIEGLAGTEFLQIGRWNGGDIEWSGATAGSISPNGNEGLVYLVAAQANSSYIPVSGTAHYALRSATRPIYKSGAGYDGSFDGEMSVLFGPSAKIGLDAVVTMEEPGGDVVYDFSTTGGAADPSQSSVDFNGGDFSAFTNISATGAACSGTCGVSFTGYTRGPGGRDTGLIYAIGSNDTIYGAAFFQRDDDPVLLRQQGNIAGLLMSPGTLSIPDGIGVQAFNNSALVTFSDGDDEIEAIEQAGTTRVYDNGTAGILDAGTAGPVSWARWSDGDIGTANNDGPSLGANQGMHLASGTPASSIPVSGTAQYALAGATSPTISDGSVAPGTFTGSLGVAFGPNSSTAKVGVDFNVSIGGHDYAIATTGGAADPTQSQIALHGAYFGTAFGQSGNIDVTPGGPACTGANCRATVSGFLSGNGASHAAVGYTISDFGSPNNTGAVQGTAVFSQVP